MSDLILTQWLRMICSLALLFILAAGCTEKSIERPNVLIILADDLGAMDPGFMGSPFYETPYLDSLASRSIVFTQGYAASRVCSPSRASILTGQFTARHGITDWIGALSGEEWRQLNRHDRLLPAAYTHNLPKEHITLAEAFKNTGYSTFFAGKWHLGKKGSYPEDHGFDINRGGWEKGSPIGGFFSPWENPSLENTRPGENLSLRLARETIDFIKQPKEKPYLAFLSFYAVHAPIQTTQQKWRKYRDKAAKSGVSSAGFEMEEVLPVRVTQDNPIYAGLLETMDEAIGLVLNAVDENTIVVFTSDNGGVASGDAYATSNLPLRGGKGYMWEGGLREPFLILIPGVKHQKIHTPVISTDLYPTLLELAGLPLMPQQHIDGVSLLPLLDGDSIRKRRLYWHYPHYGNQGGQPSSVVRENQWKLIHYWEDDHTELYDLSNDPSERSDVGDLNPGIRNRLKGRLMAFLEETNARLPVPDPLYDSIQALERHKYIRSELITSLEAQRKLILDDEFRPNPTWWDSEPGNE